MTRVPFPTRPPVHLQAKAAAEAAEDEARADRMEREALKARGLAAERNAAAAAQEHQGAVAALQQELDGARGELAGLQGEVGERE